MTVIQVRETKNQTCGVLQQVSDSMNVELLWFEGCPNHIPAEALVADVARELGVTAIVLRIEVPDEVTGKRVCFPGSPTIRVNGVDVEPGWECCDDCTPRCRVYVTPDGFRGLPPRDWVVQALVAAR